jgi:hypothetical protein
MRRQKRRMKGKFSSARVSKNFSFPQLSFEGRNLICFWENEEEKN